MISKYAIGLDFGTESSRALLVDVDTGEVVAREVQSYDDGVIDHRLPGSNRQLPDNWALQNPHDWLAALQATIPTLFAKSDVTPEDVIGIGIDFTSCTILPTRSDGRPLCTLDRFDDRPHAWPKLWKHHAAQPQADRITQMADARGEPWLPRYGGRISSEWLIPKALELLEEANEIYAKADFIVEGADWIVWQLTDRLVRNTCAAGYKANWHKLDGFPSTDFLKALNPRLTDLYGQKLAGEVLAPGTVVGGLSVGWAERLGLTEGMPIAVPMIDAHAAVLGGGVCEPRTLFMAMGTSTCHMLMAEEELLVEGISGVVEDGIVPGLFGYEAGQASVGDVFAWFVEHGVPPAYHEEAVSRDVSVHQVLSEKAACRSPGQSGLLAVDWWNGCRTPLVDADLGGLILGYSLQTTPEEIYRALIEATAFGTRLIIESFASAGIPINAVHAGGGLTKNSLLLEIYASVIGLPIEVVATDQASALGAAILGAMAGGAYDNLRDAIRKISPAPEITIEPSVGDVESYDLLYAEYKSLVDHFGRNTNSTLKRLRGLRRTV